MPATTTHTIESLIEHHADVIAFVAEEETATALDDFLYQLGVVGERLEEVRLDEDDLTTTATNYLADAAAAEGPAREVLLNHAAEYLFQVGDLADEYRDMV